MHNPKTTLWTGEWSSGTITVPNTTNYTLFQIKMSGQGTTVLAMRYSDYVRGIGGYSSATPTITTYHFAATMDEEDRDQWTFVACNSIRHLPSDNHNTATDLVVIGIVGII